MRKIIKKHQFCLELCERVRKLFSEIIFLHFVSSSFILCLSLMDLILVGKVVKSLFLEWVQPFLILMIQAPGISKAIYVNYIIAATSQVFIYSLAGGHLEETCSNIGHATYGVPWYRMDTRTKKLVLMLIVQGQRPVLIKAPFVTASLATFASVGRISVSVQ